MPEPETNHKLEYPDEPPPPVFSSWKYLYAFVLIMHAIIITLFYIFTHTYS